MNVLIACEFSGMVRRAFLAAGHNAWSCDLLSSEDGSPYHVQCDAIGWLGTHWDMLIAFPPCTFLCNSGVRWLDGGKNGARMGEMILACEFFNTLLGDDIMSAASHIPRIAIENPIHHRYARGRIRKYDQIIQPWQFGHGETKATCLWLKGLPPLQPTNIVEGRKPRVHHASPGPERWRERSRTLPGIAAAMAAQWG